MSVMILLLMVVASAGGLWIGGLYQDPASVAAMLRAYDLVTLVVVVPALAVALLPSLRGSPGAQLVWLSDLAYAVYDYAIYAFGSAFNDLFLVHVALFSLAVFALALALANLDVVSLAAGFRERTPPRSVSVLLWRRAAWGCVLATVMAVFGTVYQLSYMTALVFQANAKVPGATSFDPAEPLIAGVFAVAAVLLLGGLRSRSWRGRG